MTRTIARATPATVRALLLALAVVSGCNRQSEPAAGANVATIAAIQATIAAADPSADAYYAKHYALEEPRYWAHIAGWMPVDAIERAFIAHRPVQSILDVGCGYGTLLAYAAGIYGARGTCLDVVPYLQPLVQSRYALTYVAGNVEKDALPGDGTFDVAIMTEVLEHLNFQPVPTLKKIHAALRPGGSFFLSTPDAEGGLGRVTKYYPSLAAVPALDPRREWIDGHIWQYDQSELEGVLRAAGFEIRALDRASGPVGKHFNVWAVKPGP
jgi:2-polyprenyl-3-methyl-5-hydroxy-6-metoxy-1,4-benzoquinol methylase